MKRMLTLLPGVGLASVLIFTPPAAGAARSSNSGERAVAVPVAAHAVARAPEGRGDRDFDGFHGGVRFGGFYPFWPGYGWAPFGYGYWAPFYGYAPYYGSYGDTGGLKLKVTGPNPKHADVFANGSYVGTVDDFNGTFQRLSLRPGAYTIQIRAQGYEPLSFKVMIQQDRTITYHGEMRKAV